MVTDRLAEGVAIDEDEANIDYTFDLNEFFAPRTMGYFEHEAEVIKFLDCLDDQREVPILNPRTRGTRSDTRSGCSTASPQPKRSNASSRSTRSSRTTRSSSPLATDALTNTDPAAIGKSLDKVRKAIAEAEATGGKTITLSVGQLTTGVTVPEWTAVIMLSNLSSPAQYMQAAFRAQNPCTFERGGAGVPEAERVHLRLRPRAHADDLRRLRQQPEPEPLR